MQEHDGLLERIIFEDECSGIESVNTPSSAPTKEMASANYSSNADLVSQVEHFEQQLICSAIKSGRRAYS